MKERLGGGGGSDVYLAEQVSLAREAVVKVMLRRSETSQAASDRFLREARLASRLE